MYIPKKFRQDNQSQLVELIKDRPFATLVCTTSAGLEANHIPLLITATPENNYRLKGHIAKANPLWKTVDNNSSVLVIFHGSQSYISPSFYPTKKEHGKVVPTWNYMSVHVKGNITFISESDWKLQMLTELTDHLENDEPSPWKVTDAPDVYIEKQLGGIVGIEITVESLEGQWKLSQNQPANNQMGVVDGLSTSGRFGACEMSKRVERYGKTAVQDKTKSKNPF
ncbi:MAG: FMN-binding negative transcriptional regulator [Arenicella sp.]